MRNCDVTIAKESVRELSKEPQRARAEQQEVAFADPIHARGVVWHALDGFLDVVPLQVRD